MFDRCSYSVGTDNEAEYWENQNFRQFKQSNKWFKIDDTWTIKRLNELVGKTWMVKYKDNSESIMEKLLTEISFDEDDIYLQFEWKAHGYNYNKCRSASNILLKKTEVINNNG